ncbi:hypothetical protein DH2020_047386 [Rehmannia glutinosa]|uniref:RRM domain-containing protein n=1 Tax=Rehmannia glutinosa TaxID=99300 RepID=A0ABR0U8T2_REHGL
MQANNGSDSQQSSSKENNNIINNNNESGGSGNNKVVAPSPQVVAAAAVPGQQWVAMQYPAAAMVMQHGMMPAPPHYTPHYMPYHHHHLHHHPPLPQPPPPQQQGGSNNGGGSNGENRTIWVGDLHNWMDEDYLRSCFAATGEVASNGPSGPLISSKDRSTIRKCQLLPSVSQFDKIVTLVQVSSIKVIRNKQTGFSEGYGFVEFFTHAAAEKVLQTYSGVAMPNADQLFRLNWAAFSMGDKRSTNGSDLSIFVGDLAADVTDTLLHETFSRKYPSVKAAKVVIDANTGRSKGYGFVRFGDDGERSQAMTEMNGIYCSSRPMRIGAATPRKSSGYQQQYSSPGGYSNGFSAQGSQSDGDSVNTTVGLDPNVTDEDLRQPFSQYGEIVSVKIPVGKGCGFVQFANRNDAEEALQQLSGTTIGKQTVRLSWGRNPANKQAIIFSTSSSLLSRLSSRADYGNQWTGAYYGPPFFDAYGYALPPPHDPSMYAAAAAAYGAYPMIDGYLYWGNLLIVAKVKLNRQNMVKLWGVGILLGGAYGVCARAIAGAVTMCARI